MTVGEMVWVMAPLMISRVEALRCLRKFSRIRSMMITDSLTEYPRTASTPASTDSENSHWKNAKNPRMITTSCRLAITPDTANFHSNSMARRSEEYTSELQSLMRISYAVICLKKKRLTNTLNITRNGHITKST